MHQQDLGKVEPQPKRRSRLRCRTDRHTQLGSNGAASAKPLQSERPTHFQWTPYLAFAAIIGISGICTLFSQDRPITVELWGILGYGAVILWGVMNEVHIARPVRWMALAALAQALGYFNGRDSMDLLQPIHCAVKFLAIAGVLASIIGTRADFRKVLIILGVLLAANLGMSQLRHGYDIISDSRHKMNMVGAYGMLFAVVGYWLGKKAGTVSFLAGSFIVLATGSRSAALGAVLGCATLAILVVRGQAKLPQLNKQFLVGTMIASLAMMAVIYHRLDFEERRNLDKRLQHFLQPESARVDPWTDGVRAFLDSPWLGSGVFSASAGITHNTWLCAAVAGGVVALLALVYSQLISFRDLRARIGSPENALAVLSYAWWWCLMGRLFFEGSLGGFGSDGFNWMMVAQLLILGIGFHVPCVIGQPKAALPRRARRLSAKPVVSGSG